MARNAEVVRQWEILRAVDGARNGIGIAKLASELRVCPRTIRRDLNALCRAGFPLYDEKTNGSNMWKLSAAPFHRLEKMGLGLTEFCALYLSRTMMDALAGAPLQDDAERAFQKIEKALPAPCRRFLDSLPRVLQAKAHGRKKQDERRVKEVLERVLNATLLHRRAEMRYASASSRRTKDYVVEPQRIVYAHGGIYVVAWVPEYGEMRTFAAERVQTFGLMDDIFNPRPLPTEPFADSLGVNSGAPEEIVLDFDASAAQFVREREWHRTQELKELEGGTLRVTLNVCNDRALVAWILGFGADVRVVSPESLARDVFNAADATRRRYLRAVEPNARLAMLAMKVS